jgi:hypothetical protein
VKILITILLFGGLQLAAQDMQSCPMHKEHMKAALQHQADVEKHCDEAMGFPHDKTTHHFRLYSDGGAIEVIANDSKDTQNMQAIQSHLTHIAIMFSNGEFTIPMFVHDQVPPGVPVMKDKRAEISYTFEELPTSGRVRINTSGWTDLYLRREHIIDALAAYDFSEKLTPDDLNSLWSLAANSGEVSER